MKSMDWTRDTLIQLIALGVYGGIWIGANLITLSMNPELLTSLSYHTANGAILIIGSMFVIFGVSYSRGQKRRAFIDDYQQKLKELSYYEERVKSHNSLLFRFIEHSPMPVMLHAENHQVLKLSDSFINSTGYNLHDLPSLKAFAERLFPRRAQDVFQHFSHSYRTDERTYDGNFKLTTKDHTELLWDFYSFGVGRDEQGLQIVATLAIDVTDQKLKEKDLKHLSYHDDLTELFNRRYYNLSFNQHRHRKQAGIILADINNLKLINDVFGHQAGDRLLIRFARRLKEQLPRSATLARIGGDEFVAVLPRFNTQEVQQLIESIRTDFETDREFSPFQSVAFGFQKNTAADLQDTFAAAENILYEDKIHQHHKHTGIMVRALLERLFERQSETEARLERLRDLALCFHEPLRLATGEMSELLGLVRLHEIGSISFGRNHAERDTQESHRQHPEIGHRIVSSFPKLKNVAYAILTHHEHVDGSGFPFGLKGTQIPKTARIFRLIDDYDALTQKQEFSREAAIAHLRKYKGVHYDARFTDAFVDALLTDSCQQSGSNRHGLSGH